jgi:hypothetical protein
MKNKIKSALTAIAALGLLAGGITGPAHAAGENIDIVNTNDTLAGSTISGFDPVVTLRLAIMANMGTVTWTDNGSGANRISSNGATAQGLWLAGTQDQLNAALAEITINKPCAGNYKIYAQVTDSDFIQDPTTGHLYKLSTNSLNLDPAIAEAAATPLVPGGTDTFGYVSTITSTFESLLVSQLFGQVWVPASDRDNEGDWKWLNGPEAGTSFYSGNANSGGAVLPGKFAAWGNGEPNDWGNGEDYADIMNNGFWNDTSEFPHQFAIEWGGMPGDNLSGPVIANDNIDMAVVGAFAGAGTQADPYLVADATGLNAVAACGGSDIYFKQTANITLPNTWSGDKTFEGHYDGNGKTIAFSANTPTHDDFGVWGYAGQNNRAYIHDLTVTGDLDANGSYRVGLLVGNANNVDITNVTVDGTLTAGGSRWGVGGVAGVFYNGTMDSITSTVDINIVGDNYAVGGIAGEMNSTLRNSTWNGEITAQAAANMREVGGLVGTMDCGTIENSSSSGTITGQNGEDIGGLAGYTCGTIEDSHSSVDVTAANADYVGGLMGEGDCTDLNRSWATGDVNGHQWVGGLAGYNCSDTESVYARGNVTANDYVGSLFGEVGGWVSEAYATGTVTTSGTNTRGWVGVLNSGVDKIFWVPSQSTIAEPNPLNSGEVPYTLTDAVSFDYYSQAGWNISTNWEDQSTWTICSAANDGYPILTSSYTENPCALDQTLTPTPAITGTGVEGAQLTGDPGTWDAGVTLTFAWLRDGVVIANETNPMYVPVAADVAKSITFRVTSTKSGYKTVVKTSAGKLITAKPAVVVPPKVAKTIDVSLGGFAGNSWWIPAGFVSGIKAAVKARSKATALTCVGVVAPGGNKDWQKKLGLKRAELACAIAKTFNSKLKTTLTWKVAAKNDKIQRGATLKFNK